jgi:ubiquinone/menaquinone biosynthesis C-methylase UbiE
LTPPLDSRVVDRQGLLARLAEREHVEIELGCGASKRNPQAIGVDALELPGVDLVGDAFDVLAALPASSVDRASSYHFFEHVDDLPRLLDELARVMKRGGELVVVTPHFSNPYFYSDYTHRRTFGLYTFAYLAKCELFARAVPSYGVSPRFEVVDVRLGFRSARQFPVRYGIKRAIGSVVNLTRWTKEFWEENLCWLFPCYEVECRLRRL